MVALLGTLWIASDDHYFFGSTICQTRTYFYLQARLASANTCSLCEAAHAAVGGNPCRDELVASAKAVATSTTQLLVACRANADPNSKTQKGLQVILKHCCLQSKR